MTTSTISQNGQTTIPIQVREFLHVGPSDKIVYRIEGGIVSIEASPSSTAALYGSLKTDRKSPTKEDLREARKRFYKGRLTQ